MPVLPKLGTVTMITNTVPNVQAFPTSRVLSHLGMARPSVMVDVDQSLAKAMRIGVLEERLHEDQVVLLS